MVPKTDQVPRWRWAVLLARKEWGLLQWEWSPEERMKGQFEQKEEIEPVEPEWLADHQRLEHQQKYVADFELDPLCDDF